MIGNFFFSNVVQFDLSFFIFGCVTDTEKQYRGTAPPNILPVRSLHFSSRNSQVTDIEVADNNVESLSSGLVINEVPPIIKTGLEKRTQLSPEFTTAPVFLKPAIENVDAKPLNTAHTTDDCPPSEIFDMSPVIRILMDGQF